MKPKTIMLSFLVASMLIGCSSSKEVTSTKEDLPLSNTIPDSLQAFTSKSATHILAKQKNMCYSPFSAYMAIAMSVQGAKNDTLKQLENAISYTGSKSSLAKDSKTLFEHLQQDNQMKSANSLWLKKDMEMDANWQQTLKEQYFADSFSVDFKDNATNKQVGEWIKTNSNGQLTPKLSFDKSTMLSIISALSFEDEWKTPFFEKNTITKNFHLLDQSVLPMDFMHMRMNGTYSKTDVYEMTYLSLKNGSRMYFFLPSKDHTPQDILNSNWIKDLHDNTKREEKYLDIALPKFAYESTLDLVDMMKQLHVTKTFDSRAEFLNDLYISNITQGTHIAINEAGGEAAGYTKVDFEMTGANPEEVITMNFNRPFLYVITSKENLPLFVGTLYQP